MPHREDSESPAVSAFYLEGEGLHVMEQKGRLPPQFNSLPELKWSRGHKTRGTVTKEPHLNLWRAPRLIFNSEWSHAQHRIVGTFFCSWKEPSNRLAGIAFIIYMFTWDTVIQNPSRQKGNLIIYEALGQVHRGPCLLQKWGIVRIRSSPVSNDDSYLHCTVDHNLVMFVKTHNAQCPGKKAHCSWHPIIYQVWNESEKYDS